MEELKSVLAYWDAHKSEFDAKLVERQETGCCVYEGAEGSDCMK